MRKKNRTPALAYLRTSSAVGADKDSDKRQRAAIEAFARNAGYEIIAEFYEAVSGADAIDARPGFAAMLEHIAGDGARTIIVETANRFARDLVVQETGPAEDRRRARRRRPYQRGQVRRGLIGDRVPQIGQRPRNPAFRMRFSAAKYSFRASSSWSTVPVT
jgi:Resolvase, N terminal domain